MALYFDTTEPKKLLTTFKTLIDQKHVVTWSYDRDGDFTHTPDQWKSRGWFRPVIFNGRLVMNFLGTKSEKTSAAVYGVYHGRFLESMLTHCDTLFSTGSATALPTNSDMITSAA